MEQTPDDNDARFRLDTLARAVRSELAAAGFEVTETDNDYAPHELLVTRRLATSPWQERRDAEFARRYDRLYSDWNQRHEQECAACKKQHQDHDHDHG